jgi:adenosylmethionine---8-amino-7-oxononanoate aminotransferase
MERKTFKNSSMSMIEWDRACIWHPFTQQLNAEDPLLINRGEGLYLYTEDGFRMMDAISSWWVNLHGHAHPYIAEKIKEQLGILEHVIFTDFTHRPAIEFAKRLISRLPSKMSKVFYSDNGSTAVEAALKMVFQYWHHQKATHRKKVISFRNGYHGDTFGAMSAAGKNAFNKPFWNYLFEVESCDPPMHGAEEVSIKAFKLLLEKGDVACFIFEPLILGAGGMVLYSKMGLEAILKLQMK